MTALAGQDRRLLTDPCVIDRTVFVDTADVSAIDFDLSDALRDDLFARGVAAAANWLDQWDLETHLASCHRH
jgi:NTE family protein